MNLAMLELIKELLNDNKIGLKSLRTGYIMDENPGFVKRQLMKVDMGLQRPRPKRLSSCALKYGPWANPFLLSSCVSSQISSALRGGPCRMSSLMYATAGSP